MNIYPGAGVDDDHDTFEEDNDSVKESLLDLPLNEFFYFLMAADNA